MVEIVNGLSKIFWKWLSLWFRFFDGWKSLLHFFIACLYVLVAKHFCIEPFDQIWVSFHICRSDSFIWVQLNE